MDAGRVGKADVNLANSRFRLRPFRASPA